MKLFKVKNIVRDFASINFSDIDMTCVLKEGKIDLLEGHRFSWDKSNGTNISDCPFYIGTLPIFDSKKLGNILANSNVKIATFEVEGIQYNAIAAPKLSGSIINREYSELRTFRSGKIMNVKKYVFNKGIKYPPIFMLEEFVLSTFCDEIIAQRLLNCGFSQLQLCECPLM